MANDLANEVSRLLRAYTDEVEQDLNKVFDEVGREGVEMVTEASPVRYGKYKKGWKLKKEKNKKLQMASIIVSLPLLRTWQTASVPRLKRMSL